VSDSHSPPPVPDGIPERIVDEVRGAYERIHSHVLFTRLERFPSLEGSGGAEVRCKFENEQHTGSFKVRGAFNKILALSDEQRSRGVVAASTGNHGAAVAFAASRLGVKGEIFVTESASAFKRRLIEECGISVRVHGSDCVRTETHARAFAAERGMTYLSPYNDPLVIAGQGTIGLEIDRQLDRIDAIFLSVGGGGLLAGVAGYLKSRHPDLKVVGCSPERSPVMIRSIEAGRILELPSHPTLSDATAGGLEPGAITFDLCASLIDEPVTVTEEEIAAGIREVYRGASLTIEGAGGVAVAAWTKRRADFEGRSVVILFCGGNIAPHALESIG
jgi:threonine dehydratase